MPSAHHPHPRGQVRHYDAGGTFNNSRCEGPAPDSGFSFTSDILFVHSKIDKKPFFLKLILQNKLIYASKEDGMLLI